MDNYIEALDEYFCAQYSDYVRISAIEGYKMPEVVYIGDDGNITRRDSECMRLIHQENRAEILKTFKETLSDTDFSFSFSFVPVTERFRARHTFAKYLPDALRRAGENFESAGSKLSVEKKFWDKIVKGKVYPSKNLVLALALVCRLQQEDVNNLLNVSGFHLENDSVRDVVVQFLLSQKIFNASMRDRCLAEYKIENLPIQRDKTE